MTPDQMAELAARLHDFGKAYPVEIFPEITDAERAEHSRLITRAAAQMGRHFAKFAVPAADLIESMAQAKPVAWKAGGYLFFDLDAIPSHLLPPNKPAPQPLYLAPPAREPVAWDKAQRICDLPAVDEAIRALLADQTNDNAVALVQAVIAAAPTPPIVLPPLPSPRVPAVFATAENTESVRKGYEPGGYEKSPPLFDERQVREAQRAALAQYGIVDRQEDAA